MKKQDAEKRRIVLAIQGSYVCLRYDKNFRAAGHHLRRCIKFCFGYLYCYHLLPFFAARFLSKIFRLKHS